MIDQERRDEIDLRPGERAPDRAQGWPKTARDQEIDDPGDDPAMADEEADETDVGKTEMQVRRQDRLKGPADPPEVRDFLQPRRFVRRATMTVNIAQSQS